MAINVKILMQPKRQEKIKEEFKEDKLNVSVYVYYQNSRLIIW